MKGFARRLVLKQRHRVTQKWPIALAFIRLPELISDMCQMCFVTVSYCFISRYCSADPSINLNFSIFLYNSGERKEAVKQFNIYERKMEAYRSEKGNEIDQEVCLYLIHLVSQFEKDSLFHVLGQWRRSKKACGRRARSGRRKSPFSLPDSARRPPSFSIFPTEWNRLEKEYFTATVMTSNHCVCKFYC